MPGRARPAILDSHARFELIAKLGEGAHGEVFEALDRARGTRVALKALRDASPQNILRFKREFRSLVEIHHVNLVEFGELFEDSGRWFFSMELVEGVDFVSHARAEPSGLTGFDRSTSSESTARLTRALHQLGAGLQALHQAGKIHRDIKPSNIRVQPDGRVVLLDFGLVAPAAHDSASTLDQVVGSVGYMAPEQANARPLSPAADCYAVGVLIYEALTGEQPFEGSALEVLLAKQSRPVVLPAALATRLPANLVDLCHALCRIDPTERASVDELIARTSSPALRASSRVRVSALAPDASAVNTLCFGRDAELALLDRALEKARAGSLSKVRLCGESGVGKTALLRAFRERLAQRDDQVFVLSGGCHEQERITHKAFDAAIDELGRKLERMTHEQCARLTPKYVSALTSLFPVLGRLAVCADGPTRPLPPDPITLRRHAYAGLRDLLHRMTERSPVVLILDDMQWSDTESLELLAALTRTPDPAPLLLLAAMWPLDECPPELNASLERTFSADDTLEIAVRTLPSAAAVDFARQLLAATTERSVQVSPEQLAEAAGYHPLFIEVLARAAEPGAEASCQLEEALWNEMAALSARAHRLLQLIAVAGTSIAEHTLAEAAGLTSEALAEALAELRRGKFVRTGASAGEFSVSVQHVKIRDALLAHVDEQSLRQHHFALANALTRGACRDPEALALHWLQAGEPRNAASYFEQAAASAQRSRAFDHAAQLYRSALDALDSLAVVREEGERGLRSQWLQSLAMVLAQAGRNVEAAEAFLAAAAEREPHATRELRRSAAEHFLRAGMIDSGRAIARPLLAEIGEPLATSSSGALAGLAWRRACLELRGTKLRERAASAASDRERYACDLLWSISVPMVSLDFVRGLDLHHRGLLRALRLGDRARAARSLAMHALYMKTDGPDAELRARGLLATVEALARRENDPYLLAFSQMCHSTFQLLHGDPTGALSLADSAASLFEDECQNVSWEIGVARATALTALSFLGSFRELAVRFDAAAEEAEARGNVHGFATLVTLNRCSIDLAADRVDSCRAELQALMQSCPAEWHLQHAFALGANVMLDLYVGGSGAHRRLSDGWKQLRHQLILTSDRFRIFFLFVRGVAALCDLLTDQRDPHARIRLVRDCAMRLAREPMRDAKGGAHMLRGQLAVLQGDLTSAVREYRASAEFWGHAGMYGGKIAKLRLGEILGGDEGAALIADCMSWATDEGIRRPEQFFRVCAPVVPR